MARCPVPACGVFLGPEALCSLDRAVSTVWSTCLEGAGKGVSAPHGFVSLKFHCHSLIYGCFYLKVKVSFLSCSSDFLKQALTFSEGDRDTCRPCRGPAPSATCHVAVSFQYLFFFCAFSPCYKLLRRDQDHRLLAPVCTLPHGHHLIYCCTCRRDCFCIFAIKNFRFEMLPVSGWCGREACVPPCRLGWPFPDED